MKPPILTRASIDPMAVVFIIIVVGWILFFLYACSEFNNPYSKNGGTGL